MAHIRQSMAHIRQSMTVNGIHKTVNGTHKTVKGLGFRDLREPRVRSLVEVWRGSIRHGGNEDPLPSDPLHAAPESRNAEAYPLATLNIEPAPIIPGGE